MGSGKFGRVRVPSIACKDRDQAGAGRGVQQPLLDRLRGRIPGQQEAEAQKPRTQQRPVTQRGGSAGGPRATRPRHGRV